MVNDLIRQLKKSKAKGRVIPPLESELVRKIREQKHGSDYDKDYEILLSVKEGRAKIKDDLPEPAKKERYSAIIAFDTTYSMFPFISEVKSNIECICEALFKQADMDITIAGVGDHEANQRPKPPNLKQEKGKNTEFYPVIQITNSSQDVEGIKKNLESIEIYRVSNRDQAEAYECLFKELNKRTYDQPTILTLMIDSVPHGVSGFKGGDMGCPYNVDYKKELEELKGRIKNMYVINCGDQTHKGLCSKIQRGFVDHNKFFMELEDAGNLPELIKSMYLSETSNLSCAVEDKD